VASELSWESVLAWRMEREGIAQRATAEHWMAVVRRVCGLHAQVQSCAELTLWARVDGLARDVLAQALWEERSLVRTWAMRGTLHLLPADELGLWVGAQAALTPRYETASWRKAFGMSSAEAVAVLDAVRDALDGPPLTAEGALHAAGPVARPWQPVAPPRAALAGTTRARRCARAPRPRRRGLRATSAPRSSTSAGPDGDAADRRLDVARREQPGGAAHCSPAERAARCS
jgi:uncharacterized protein YcaQ